jgi:hypothetical protein
VFDLYCDENVQDRVLLQLLRRSEVNCLTSNEADKGAASDQEQLAFATRSSRTILTFDRVDYQRLHGDWMRAGRSHQGIIIVTSAYVSTVDLYSQLMRLQAERSAHDMANAILFIRPTALGGST